MTGPRSVPREARGWRLPGPLSVVFAAAGWCIYLLWIHALVRDSYNLRYYREYEVARCTSKNTVVGRSNDRAAAPSVEELTRSAERLTGCQDIRVSVDGVWGGLWGKPSLRLIVRSGADSVVKYYSVSINPIAGVASIRFELSPSMYYLNL